MPTSLIARSNHLIRRTVTAVCLAAAMAGAGSARAADDPPPDAGVARAHQVALAGGWSRSRWG